MSNFIQKPGSRFSGAQDEAPGYRWLSAADEQNPFTIDGYDCLGYVSSLVTTTSDVSIAESFVAMRESGGLEYVNTFPNQPVQLSLDLVYPLMGEVADGIVFKAAQMEEKWDVYWYAPYLYFCPSWTGQLVFAIQFEILPAPAERILANNTPLTFCARSVLIAKDSAKDDEGFIVRQVDYLIKRFLFRRRVPHPLPPDLERDAETAAAYSFSVYGNMCCFGSFEDTLPHDLLKSRSRQTHLE